MVNVPSLCGHYVQAVWFWDARIVGMPLTGMRSGDGFL